MKRTLFLAAIALAVTSCQVGEKVPDCVCMENVELTFRYHFAPTQEDMPIYVGSITHLLFRNDTLVGRLYVDGHVDGEGLLDPALARSGEGTRRNTYNLRTLRLSLPDGRYDLMSWGNYLEGTSLFEDAAAPGAPLQIGETLRKDVSLRHVIASPANHGTLDNCERLYFGSYEFDVVRNRHYSHTIDMINAHMQLTAMVIWGDGVTPPADLRDLRMRLSDTPTGYSQFVTDTLPLVLTAPQPAYGPRQAYEMVPAWDGNLGTISAGVSPLETNKVSSQLIGYRLRDESHPLLSVWDAAGTTQLVKDVDLGRFFETIGWARTCNRRQVYDILVTLRANGDVTVEPLDNIGWIDGGTISAAP